MPKVLITGSGRRLGRALALGFANKGWDVAVHYGASEEAALKTVKDIEAAGSKAILVQADLRKSDEVAAAFTKVGKEFGEIDLLINNAGFLPQRNALEETKEADWDEVLDINLKAAFLCSKEFLKIKAVQARVINIACIGGNEVWQRQIAYNISKGGLLHLTKVLARDLAPEVAVNSVSPGVIDIREEPSDVVYEIDPKRIPMQKYGSAEDIFEACWFFATCSRYITGQNISVDGGFSLVK
jgi:NAD(P)-dependent dehydrogenase (short-subunit alcohol dehydrogenase family)